jgi:putative transposase
MSEPTTAQSIRLTDQQTLHDTMLMGQRHISLHANGYSCQTADVWRIVLAAAARRTTIEAACADLERTPDANTVRGYLTAQLAPADIPDQERQWNALFRMLLPEWLAARPQEIAVDFHDEPYYGHDHPDDPDTWVCRGEARAGTTRFYRCATAYVMQRDVRLTLAVVFVKPSMDKVTVLKRLLHAVQAAGVSIKCLYADKAFCSIPVLRYLSYRAVPTIIAMPIRGKQAGTRALCQGRTSYRTSYTLQSAENGSLRVPVAVVRTWQRRRSGQRQVRFLVYVCLRVRESARQIRLRYRRRFGIESGYRLMEQVRARTTSPNPALRFLLMGVALLIVNMWIRLHWLYLRVPGRGPRRVVREYFRLERMTRFLTRAIERIYGVISAVDPPPKPKPVIY